MVVINEPVRNEFFTYRTHSTPRDMLWEEELEAKRIQDDEDRKRKVRWLDPTL